MKNIFKSQMVIWALVFVSAFLVLSKTDLFADISNENIRSTTNINTDPDTLTTSTSLDTITFSLQPYYSAQDYTVQMNADSISGATGATCYLQVNTDMGGSDWATLETMVIDGVQTRTLETGTVKRGTLRVVCYAPSSTQSTAVRIDFTAHTPY